MGKLAEKVLKIWRGAPPEPVVVLDLVSVQREVDKLRAQIADIQLQWAEVLDKIAAWGNRQAARDRARVKESLRMTAGGSEVEGEELEGRVEGEMPPAGHPAPSGAVDGGGKADLYARMRARGIR